MIKEFLKILKKDAGTFQFLFIMNSYFWILYLLANVVFTMFGSSILFVIIMILFPLGVLFVVTCIFTPILNVFFVIRYLINSIKNKSAQKSGNLLIVLHVFSCFFYCYFIWMLWTSIY